jgi:pSer/pThr/pTyr-binding forkhead associated (FHA) protein
MTRTRPGLLTYHRDEGADESVLLVHDVTTLGRSDTCAVAIPAPTVSRLHARIELQHDRYVLFDAGSANGTFVNGKRIQDGYQLSTGDEIWLGSQDESLCFYDPEETLVVPINQAPPALYIDENAHAVQVYGVAVPLSPPEYRMLQYLATNPGTVCTREACFLAVWGQPYDPTTCEDALNACIAKLRRNLRAIAQSLGHESPLITTIQRIGFRLDAEVTFAPRHEAQSAVKERVYGT